MKTNTLEGLFKNYSWKDLRADSRRALADAHARLFQKNVVDKTAQMRKERISKSGIAIRCVIAAALITLISVNGWA